MPFYEYRCGKCAHEFEEMQRITDPPVHKCPKCGKKAVERLISRTSFVLKGSGWYVTDYGRSGSSAPTAGDGGSGNGSGKGESKAESPNGREERVEARREERLRYEAPASTEPSPDPKRCVDNPASGR